VGQRLFFLHDGRTSDLGAAIEAHMSAGASCVSNAGVDEAMGVSTLAAQNGPQSCASEANAVVQNYNALSASQQTDLLTFLRAL
jgi:hypothetical protein